MNVNRKYFKVFFKPLVLKLEKLVTEVAMIVEMMISGAARKQVDSYRRKYKRLNSFEGRSSRLLL
jgi:hypothetical protein